jgi:hypothetical protein
MKPWCGTVAITMGGQTYAFWVYSPATPGEEQHYGPHNHIMPHSGMPRQRAICGWTDGAKTGCVHEHHQQACVLDCTPGEELRAVVKALPVEKRFDPLTDLGMPGRIGMDAIKQQLLIAPIGGPGAEELNIGDRFGGRGLPDRRLELCHGGILVGPVRHPGDGRGAGVIHRREPDPAEAGCTRPGLLKKRPDIGADVCGRGDRLAIDELGIVDASGKYDEVPWLGLARLELDGEPLAELRGGLAHDAQVVEKRAAIVFAPGGDKHRLAQPLHPAALRVPGAIGNTVTEDEDFDHRLAALLRVAGGAPLWSWWQTDTPHAFEEAPHSLLSETEAYRLTLPRGQRNNSTAWPYPLRHGRGLWRVTVALGGLQDSTGEAVEHQTAAVSVSRWGPAPVL